jgi:hypothetical protein
VSKASPFLGVFELDLLVVGLAVLEGTRTGEGWNCATWGIWGTATPFFSY